jgi:hypothetical protein
MKPSRKPVLLPNWIVGLLGAVGIWDGLMQIATHNDPIFGSLEKYSPKWAAALVVSGVLFLSTAVSIWIKHAKEDKD